MIKKYYLSVLITLCSFSTFLQAQNEETLWNHEIRVGINLGGTSPLPLPAEIRKVKSFTTGVNPVIGFRSTRWMDKHSPWGISTGLTIDYRGMETSAKVKYWHTDLEVGEGEQTGRFTGSFSGENKTTVKNGYLTIPLQVAYRPFDKWHFHAGAYFSWILTSKFEGSAKDGYIREGGPTGDRITVENATYNFSDELRNVDAGIMAGADWKIAKRISATGELTWGLLPIFPGSFNGVGYKMYNIYLSLGLSYQL